MISEAEKLKLKRRAKAHSLVSWAVKTGKLTRPNTCELCGRQPEMSFFIGNENKRVPRTLIVAHHWNGYDDPYNVWFICASCNLTLGSRHDGSMNRKQARLFIAQSKLRKSDHLMPMLEDALRQHNEKYGVWKVNVMVRFCNQI